MRFLAVPFLLLLWVLPLVVTVWVLLKIKSIDDTLKEISRKLDRNNL